MDHLFDIDENGRVKYLGKLTPYGLLTLPEMSQYYVVQNDRVVLPTAVYAYPELTYQQQYLNTDPNVKKKMANYIHDEAINNWLYNHESYRDLARFFDVEKSDDKIKVSLIKDEEKQANIASYSDVERKAIYRYIEENFLTKKFIAKNVEKYVEKENLYYFDLYIHKSEIRRYILKKLETHIKSAIHYISGKKY
jgi:hypothetical protein